MKVLRITTLGILIALAITGGAFTAALVGAQSAQAGCAADNMDCRTSSP